MKTKPSLVGTTRPKTVAGQLRSACATRLMVLLLALPAAVQAEDYNYTTNNGMITITGYTGPGGAVTIPGTINGLPVTTIGSYAFYGSTNVISVAIPGSVTNIGNTAFSYCISLTAITVDTNNPLYSSVDGVLFNKSQTALSRYPAGKAGSQYTIPDSVTTIEGSYGWSGEGGAFAHCTSLTNVTIGNSVTSIGEAAFSRCTSLTSITIPNSVASIGYAAFSRCISLSSVFIPNSVTSIGVFAFAWCTNLRAITVDALNSMYSSVDGVLFNKSQTTLIQCPGRKSGSDYMIPNDVTSIEGGAFWDCTSLTSITIPNSVTDIGSASFFSCSSLTNATIPDSVTSIGSAAFYYCTSLTSVRIGTSVTSIGGSAFYYCTSLTNVTIGNSVTTIGDGAFQSCISLPNITIPNSVTKIGLSTFDSCSNLTEVHFQGNAPGVVWGFLGHNNATVYYLPGTTGWSATFGERPTALWVLPSPVILNSGSSFGIQTNRFGFLISWATNLSVLVEASTDLAISNWSPVGTNILTSGSSYFSDPQWKNHPARFYRLRSQ